jgi:glycosyltransferase involved in cell wall biosynthesis
MNAVQKIITTMRNRDFKVSILVSTYNWPEALELSIKSMWRQSVLPNEIVIADDGSDEKTKELITRLQKESCVPIVHVWHPDEGFRRTEILNKAIAKAKGDYILQVDGDVILARHFVSDHIELAEKNHFVCGSRVKLQQPVTERIFASGEFPPHFWEVPPGFLANSFRSRLLRRYMAKRYAREIDHLRGCNMAFWKEDVIKVNGYNEELQQWGHEDGEFAFRLHFAGVEKKALKGGGCVYHLYHPEVSKSNEERHLEELEKVKSGKLKWCDNGIDKYL